MYEPGTILTLKEPRSVGTPGEDSYEEFPYDRVRVLGGSPINHGATQSEWVGADANGIIIEPLNGFGANADEPQGRIQSLYDVESIPEREIDLGAPVKVTTQAQAGPTPEEVFAAEAPADKAATSKDGERVRSPLDQPSTSTDVKADPPAKVAPKDIQNPTGSPLKE